MFDPGRVCKALRTSEGGWWDDMSRLTSIRSYAAQSVSVGVGVSRTDSLASDAFLSSESAGKRYSVYAFVQIMTSQARTLPRS